jgi:Flp pilus assembly pilin Flp
MKRILGYLKDERGVETLEWIAVGALIVALAMAVYPGTLQTGINDVITDIVTALTGIVGT